LSFFARMVDSDDEQSDSNPAETMTANVVGEIFTKALARTFDGAKSVKVDYFHGYASESILRWVDDFEYAAMANGWHSDRKKAKYPSFLQDTAREWYNLNVRDGPLKESSYEDQIKELKKYFSGGKEDEDVLRDELDSTKQGKSDVSRHILRVRSLCHKIDPKMKDSEVIRFIVKGMDSTISREIYLRSEPATVDELEERARKIEISLNKFPGSQKDEKLLEKIASDIEKLNFGNYDRQRNQFENRRKGNERNEFVRYVPMAKTHHDRIGNRIHQTAPTIEGRQRVVLLTNTGQQNARYHSTYGNEEEIQRPHSSCYYCGKYGHRSKYCSRRINQNESRRMNNERRYGNFSKQDKRPWTRTAGGETVGNFSKQDKNTWTRNTGGETAGRSLSLKQGDNPWIRNAGEQTALERRVMMTYVNGNLNVQTLKNLITTEIEVNRTAKIIGVVDTGSQVTLLRQKEATDAGLFALRKYKGTPIQSTTGDSLNVEGITFAMLKPPRRPAIRTKLLIVEDLPVALLLGQDFNGKANMHINTNTGEICYQSESDGNVSDSTTESRETEPRPFTSVEENAINHAKMEISPVPLKGKPGQITPEVERQLHDEGRNQVSLNFDDTDGRTTEPESEESQNKISVSLANKAKSEYGRDSRSYSEGPVHLKLVSVPDNPVSMNRIDGKSYTTNCIRGKAKSRKQEVILKDHSSIQSTKPTGNTLESASIPTKHISANSDDWDSSAPMEVKYAEIAELATKTQEIPLSDDEHAVNVSVSLNGEQIGKLRNLLMEFRDCFSYPGDPIGKCDLFMHDIDTGDSAPVYRQPVPVNDYVRKELNRHIKRLLEMKAIRESRSEWASVPHLVDKKDGDSRMVINYIPLNRVTKADRYPSPDIDTCLMYIRGSSFFTSIDLMQGFHQIAVHPASVPKTAFVTQDGMYEYLRMPFGLRNAPATFQRTMDKVLAGVKYNSCLVFFDDILIFSKTFEEHLERIRAVFTRLAEAGLTVKPSKAFFGVTGCSFLGYFLDRDGLKMLPGKVEAMLTHPIPVCSRDVKSFHGLASFYRRFVPGFAKIVKPMVNLLRQDVAFHWGPEQQTAFEEITRLLSSYPILTHYDPSLPMELRTDASGYGIGAVLGHIKDGKFHPIQFASRTLSDAETRYSTIEKEALAIVWAVTHKFARHLRGFHFKIICDNQSLMFMSKKSKLDNLSNRLLKFKLELEGFDYEITYKPGTQNKDADDLSRYPVGKPENTEDQLTILSLYTFRKRPGRKPKFGRGDYLKLVKYEQENDGYFGPIRRIVEQQGSYKRYAIIDDILYRTVDRRITEKYVICIPKTLVEDVLQFLHDDIDGCHLGVAKTLGKLRERFFFPKMESLVRNYIRSCTSCLTRKQENLKPRGILCSIEPGAPFDLIGIDIWGPVKRTERRNRYIVVATDYLSRYVELKAIPEATSDQVAVFLLENIIRTHGVPSVILSDRGKCFLSNAINKLYHAMQIRKIFTTPYRPQTNGLTEAFNKTLGNMISHYVSQDQRDWDLFLPWMQLTYNSSIHSAHQFSPFFVLFGREPRLNVDIAFDLPREGNSDWEEYVTEHQERLGRIQEIVRQNIRKAQRRSKAYYDRGRRNESFAIEDLVLLYNPRSFKGKTNKLLHRFNGPYRISEILSNNTVRIELVSRPRINQIANIESLKPFYPRELYTSSGSDTEILELPNAIESKSDDEATEIIEELSEQLESCDGTFETAIGEPYDGFNRLYDLEKPYQEELNSHLTVSQTDASDDEPSFTENPYHGEKNSHKRITSGEAIVSDSPTNNDVDTDFQKSQQPPSIEDVSRTNDNSSSEDQIPALRKSSRTRRPPKRLSYAALVSLAIVTVFYSPTNTSFTKVAPIVWRETNKQVVSGITHVDAHITYTGPCFIFNASVTPSYEPYTQQLRDWCEETFEETFEETLETFCESPPSIDKLVDKPSQQGTDINPRKKRELLTMVGIGSLVLVGGLVVGFGSWVIKKAFGTPSDQLERELDTATEDLKCLTMDNAKVRDVIKHLSQMSELHSRSLKNVLEKLNTIVRNNVATLTTTSTLNSLFLGQRDKIKDIAHDWKRGKFNEKLVEVLKLNLSCGNDCHYELFTPGSCRIDRIRKYINIKFIQKTVNDDTEVLKADPFEPFHIDPDNPKKICKMEYTGPTYVMYEKASDCVTPLRDYVKDRDYALAPAFEHCQESLTMNATDYWKPESCQPAKTVRKSDILQIKDNGDYNTVYCPTLNITVFNRTYNCPDYIFALPNFTSFTIGKLNYKADQLKIKSTLQVSTSTSTRINYHIIPVLPDFDISPLYEAIKMESKIEDIHHKITYQLYNYSPWIIVIFVIFELAIVCFIWIRKNKKKGLNVHIHETMELTEDDDEANNQKIKGKMKNRKLTNTKPLLPI